MTTYYIKTGGNDGADGLSDANAWATVGKVNGGSYSPGDNIYFNRGNTWTDAEIRLTWSGSEGSPITFGAYGTGARPKLSALNNPGFYSPLAVQQSYLTIDGFELECSGNYYAGMHVALAYSLINDCVCHGYDNNGISLENSSHDNTVSSCVAYSNGQHGIFVEGGAGTANNIVEYCEAYNNGISSSADHGIYLGHPSSGCVARYSVAYDNASGGIKNNAGVDAWIIGNRCYGNGSAGIILDTESGYPCDGTIVAYNLCYDNAVGLYLLGTAADPVEACFIHNNHFVNNSQNLTNGQVRFLYDYQGGSAGNTFRNNILYYDNALGAQSYLLRFANAADVADQDFDYNTYWFEGRSPSGVIIDDGAERTFAYWQATSSQDANGQQADPLFLAEYTNLHLKSASPCIEAGTPIAGLTVDCDGIPLGRGTNPDIGAFETLKGGPRGL